MQEGSNKEVLVTTAEERRIAEVRELASRGDGAVGELVRRLADPSWTVRRSVIAALATAGVNGVERLCTELREERRDETRIAAVMDALAAIEVDPLEAITRLTTHPDPHVVSEAAMVLGRRRDPRAVPVLVELTRHSDDNVAVAAIEALGRIGGRAAVESLIEALKSGSFFRVFPAIDVLGRSRDPRAIPALSAFLKDAVYVLEAARALGRSGEVAAIPPLVELLATPSEVTARVAAAAIFELCARRAALYGSDASGEQALRRANPGTSAMRRLVEALAGSDERELIAISFLLGVWGGEDALEGLRSLISRPGRVAEYAARALDSLSAGSIDRVAEALRRASSRERVVLLPYVKRATARRELIECLNDEDPAVRALACDAIARVRIPEAIGTLFTLLADPEPHVAHAAAAAIQNLGAQHVHRLAIDAAKDPRAAVRRAAMRIIGYFGFDDALEILAGARRDDDPRVREAGIAALAFLETPHALDELLVAVRDEHAEVRASAVRALGHCAGRDPRIDAATLRALEDADPWVRYYACQSAGRRGLDAAARMIVPLVNDSAGHVRIAAIEALSCFETPDAVKAMLAAASDSDPDLQRAALIGLGITKRPEGHEAILRAVRSPDAATRLVAVAALAGSGAPEELSTLADAAQDRDDDVRAAALGHLAALPGEASTAMLVAQLRTAPDPEKLVAALAVPVDGRVEALRKAVETADDESAPLICAAIARMHTAASATALEDILLGSGPTAKKAAAAALAFLGTPRALEVIARSARSDPDPEVRKTCSVLAG